MDVDAASPGEVTLIEPLLEQAVTTHVPKRLIYDRAADSDDLRERLAERGIELILSASKGPCPASFSRRSPAATLSKALDRRTYHQLAASLPPTCYPL